MAQSQNQSLQQNIAIRLSQQQLRFVRLLEDTAPEFDEAVARELADNPALEAKEPEKQELLTADGKEFTETSDQMQKADYLHTEDIPYSPRNRAADSEAASSDFRFQEAPESLAEYLLRQLPDRNLSEHELRIAEYIIGSIDSNGYLRRSAVNLADDMAFGPGIDATPEETQEVLDVVRSLDPPGVGAADLRDNLLLQLTRLPASQERDDAIEIISDFFEEFAMKHTHQIISGTKHSQKRIAKALDLILTLNPKPGAAFDSSASDVAQVIIPDFIVNDDDGKLSITLNNRIPDLQVEKSFEDAVAEVTSASGRRRRKGAEFIVDRTNDARDFIRIVRQRQETLMNVMAAIVEIQKEYFLTGDVYLLKPMMIKDIAARTGLDISVISRATKNKYVQTPYDVVPARFFFSDSIGSETGSEAITNRKIEAAIKTMTDAEDKHKPLSDEKIREALLKAGLDVSRRTVAKYRDRLGIPVARLRKNM